MPPYSPQDQFGYGVKIGTQINHCIFLINCQDLTCSFPIFKSQSSKELFQYQYTFEHLDCHITFFLQGVPHQYGLHQYEFHQYDFQCYRYKISTSGISSIAYVVKFILVGIDYVVPTSTNFTSTIFPRSQNSY